MARLRFYQLQFTHNFDSEEHDETYFAYSFPYTFSRLANFLYDLKLKKEIKPFFKDATPLCSSLSGVEVPYLIVTSRAHQESFDMIDPDEHEADSVPVSKKKKTIFLTGRVHPGEANSSFMMEGFIKMITSKNNQVAIELRKRIVFKIVPFTNPDGVIVGNYRVSMSGNDLNRRYQKPHPQLHPIVFHIKKIIGEECKNQINNPNRINEDSYRDKLLAFIDMHGHSRKKNVFMYGPEFPIHDTRYLSMRIIPKLMSENTELFRFFSCNFRVQPSKERTARVVLWREFNITNCFTLESSFQGYFDSNRVTHDFMPNTFSKIGDVLLQSLFEYVLMKEEDERQSYLKRKMKQQ